jgi:hypothetical protein
MTRAVPHRRGGVVAFATLLIVAAAGAALVPGCRKPPRRRAKQARRDAAPPSPPLPKVAKPVKAPADAAAADAIIDELGPTEVVTVTLEPEDAGDSRYAEPAPPVAAAPPEREPAPAPAKRERSPVPRPSETPARIIVSGRTSTAVDIKIVKVGQHVPKLLPRQQGKVANTPGFTWYVSRHYALKSQMPEKFSRHILMISELAYPHIVRAAGFEPAGIEDARMAIVYAKTRKDVDRSVRSDLDSFWAGDGGGVTLNSNCVAYNYPSGGLMYHKRDLVIHENFHMHVMNSAAYRSPAFREFITLAGANHVYDEKAKRLTLFVVDKATTNNPYDRDLRAMREKFASITEVMTTGGKVHKMLGIQFFMTDPDRLMKWRLWRDEGVGREDGEDLEQLLEEICGPLDELNDEWRKWAAARRNTFHYFDWGWEQSGNTLWSYGWPQKGPHSRTDVNMPPGERPAYDPLVMDYPATAKPEIVGEVARGVAEPAVGCVIDFSRNPGKGVAGIGLGVTEKSGYAKVLVKAGKELVIDGADLGLGSKTFPFPGDLAGAMKRSGHRVGMNVKIARRSLDVTLRAGKGEGMATFAASLPVTDRARRRLLEKPLAILARSGYHGVTPFFDGRRRTPPDLSVPAPPNRWRFAGLDELYGLYRAAFRLGPKTPRSLTRLKARMVEAVDKEKSIQDAAMAAWDAGVERVMRDVVACGADPELVRRALADVAGISLSLALQPGEAAGEVIVEATANGPVGGRAEGNVGFAVTPARGNGLPREAVAVPAGERAVVRRRWRPADPAASARVVAVAHLTWRGVPLSLTAERSLGASIPRWWIVGPFANPGGWERDTKHAVETAPVDLAARYAGAKGARIGWQKAERPADLPLTDEHFIDLADMMRPNENVAAYALAWIVAPAETDAVLAIGSDDGVVAWLNGEQVHANHVGRGYTSREDRVDVRLKRGRNKLMLKITQGNGGWCFAAHLEDAEGRALQDVAISLDPDG